MISLVVNFATTNSHKFAVARRFFDEAGLHVDLRQYDLETPEIQADTVAEVALSSARWAAEQLRQPVVAADAGLYIEELNGFPGPYIKYINSTLSPQNILAMLTRNPNRRAKFVDALAYYDPNTEEGRVFSSVTFGKIASKPAAAEGSSTDRIFIPDGFDVPLADMREEDRTAVWNTDRWQGLVEYLAELTQSRQADT